MMWTGGRRKTVGKRIGCLRYISGVRTKQYLLMLEKLAVVIFASQMLSSFLHANKIIATFVIDFRDTIASQPCPQMTFACISSSLNCLVPYSLALKPSVMGSLTFFCTPIVAIVDTQ